MSKWVWLSVYSFFILSCREKQDMDLYIPEVFINTRNEVFLILKNQGHTFIPHRHIDLEVYWDDTSYIRFNLDTVDPHFRNPRDSSILRLPFKVSRASHRVKARVDNLNLVPESNEAHNIYTKTLNTILPDKESYIQYPLSKNGFEPERYLELISNPPFANNILWHEENKAYPLAYWRKSWKDQLMSHLEAIYLRTPVNLPDSFPSAFTREEAFSVFLNYAAHSLYLEKEKAVPWSVRDFSNEEMAGLWDSRHYFVWDSLYQVYRQGYQNSGAIFLHHPLSSYQFASFLKGNREDIPGSIRRFMEWGRAYLLHTERMGQPLFQSIEEMLYPHTGEVHAVYSCWATGGLMMDYCRSLNIPVRRHNIELSNGTHNQLEFPTEAWFLMHADDIYDPLYYPQPEYIAATQVLFNKSEINQLLRRKPLCVEDSCHNAGTQISFDRRRSLMTKALDLKSGYFILQYDQGRSKFREFVRGDQFEFFLVPLFAAEEEKTMIEKIKVMKPDYKYIENLYKRFEACKNNKR